MATLEHLLNGGAEDLVRLFYKARDTQEKGFIARIDAIANRLGLNHTQLVCGLGFNREIGLLPDVLSVVGFSSERALILRRDELFKTDVYRELSVDDVIEIYALLSNNEDTLQRTRELIVARLTNIEESLAQQTHSGLVSLKLELHAIYHSPIANEEFVDMRWQSRTQTNEVQYDELEIIVDKQIVPAGNLFFSNALSPAEKLFLIERGEIDVAMIKNRMQNTEISAAERDMLEDNLR